MDDDALRSALRRYAEPVQPDPEARSRVLERLGRRRRRRRRRAAGIAAVVLLVAGTAGVAGGLRGDDGRAGPPPSDRGTEPVRGGDWRELPPGPLSARHLTVGAWTGTELVVVGGTTAPVCPPTADCAAAGRETWRSDGAAYDPATETWRSIAAAPRAVVGGLAVWSGAEVVVPDPRGTLAYDPAADSWRPLDAAPGGFDRAVATDAGIAFSSYQQGPAGGDDWLLDPEAGTWTPLPRDPFGESYDRSLTWDGTRLWLLSMSVEEHFGAHEGSPSRIAVLEPGPGGLADGTWRVVDRATPDLGYEQDGWWAGDRLVVPASSYGGTGRAYDPESGEWSELPDPGSTEGGCPLPAAGPGPDWVSGGGPALVSTAGDRALQVPRCPALVQPDLAVWAGATLLVWGGAGPDWIAVAGGIAWTPPAT